jgi:hypothetical protein
MVGDAADAVDEVVASDVGAVGEERGFEDAGDERVAGVQAAGQCIFFPEKL